MRLKHKLQNEIFKAAMIVKHGCLVFLQPKDESIFTAAMHKCDLCITRTLSNTSVSHQT